MWMSFDNSSSRFQFVEAYNWIESSNIIFYLGVDGISLFFILLTTLLIPICLLASWDEIKFNEKEYFIAFLAMEALVVAVFLRFGYYLVLCFF
jgi:NADH-quinone oxidoreductase subunit M